jgi:hypothetical protein
MPGLGRLPAPDPRDRAYSMLTLIAETPPTPRRFRYWNASGWWGDQGWEPQCVGYAWTHWLEDGPVTHPGPVPLVSPAWLYGSAQKVDEWEGEGYAGTSVRAGAKVLHDLGYIDAYLWAFDVDTVVEALLTIGPVVVGTDWYESMFRPEKGQLYIDGRVVGGHAYVLNGVNTDSRRIRVKNSWGRGWGVRGHAWVTIDDMGRLIEDAGEACLAIETGGN